MITEPKRFLPLQFCSMHSPLCTQTLLSHTLLVNSSNTLCLLFWGSLKVCGWGEGRGKPLDAWCNPQQEKVCHNQARWQRAPDILGWSVYTKKGLYDAYVLWSDMACLSPLSGDVWFVPSVINVECDCLPGWLLIEVATFREALCYCVSGVRK